MNAAAVIFQFPHLTSHPLIIFYFAVVYQAEVCGLNAVPQLCAEAAKCLTVKPSQCHVFSLDFVVHLLQNTVWSSLHTLLFV